VAVAIGPGAFGARGNSDIWVYDLGRGILTRLTFQGENFQPVWTPDGKRITFISREAGKNTLSWAPADGSGATESLALLKDVTSAPGPSSWSPDGKLLAFTRGDGGIGLLPRPGAAGDSKPQPFLQTQFRQTGGAFSPDGRWIAYISNESGTEQIYVRPAPTAAGPAGSAGKWQVSTDGGRYLHWARGGRELFYRNGDKMMAVEIEPGGAPSGPFRSGTPKLLFSYASPSVSGAFDVSPDGKRFLMIKPGAGPEAGPPQVQFVLEWFEEIRRRVRAGG